MNYVYIVECKDGTFYTGWTTNIRLRINIHNQGKGAKYTRGRYPVILRYLEMMESKSDALKREKTIKKMSRGQKQALINSINKSQDFLNMFDTCSLKL